MQAHHSYGKNIFTKLQLELIKRCYPVIDGGLAARILEGIENGKQESTKYEGVVKQPFDFAPYKAKDFNPTLRGKDIQLAELIKVTGSQPTTQASTSLREFPLFLLLVRSWRTRHFSFARLLYHTHNQ